MKAQYSTEYLFVIGLVLMFLVPLLIFTEETLRVSSDTYQAKKSADRIADAIRLVSSQGYPARMKVRVLLPDSIINGSSVTNKTVMIKLPAPGGTKDIISIVEECAYGPLPERGGIYDLYVIVHEGGCMSVSAELIQLSPPSISIFIAPNTSASTSISATNFDLPTNLDFNASGTAANYLDLDPSAPGRQSSKTIFLDKVALLPIEVLPAPVGVYTGAITATTSFYSKEIPITINVALGDTTPPIISNVHNTPPSAGEQVYVLWDTDEPANSTAGYSVNFGAFSNVFMSNYTTGHNISIGSFSGGNYVRYYVTSCDSYGNCATDNRSGLYYNFTIPSDTTPPVISNIAHTPSQPSSGQIVYVSFSTNEPANTTVSRRVNAGAWTNFTNSTFSTSHNQSIASFTTNQFVQYHVSSCDSSNNCATSNNSGIYYNFTVLPNFTDIDQWQLFFDPASDFNYKPTGAWTIKAWLRDQNRTLLAGKSLSLNLQRIGTGSIITGSMTNNGDGSYTWIGSIPGNWNNNWAQLTITVSDGISINRNLVYQRVIWVKNSAGSSNRPWKIELDPSSNKTYTIASNITNVTVRLYNAQASPMSGENMRITVTSEGGTAMINNQAMTNLGSGYYNFTISSGTLTAGTDYRMRTSVTKTISGLNYIAAHDYLVEAVN